MAKIILIAGALLCFFAVAIGAFGAHALSDLLQENGRVDVYKLANHYQFYHGLTLLLVGGLSQKILLRIKGAMLTMMLGVVIFCGSLYTLSLTNLTWLGAVTPVGGALLLFAWLMLAWQFWQTDDDSA